MPASGSPRASAGATGAVKLLRNADIAMHEAKKLGKGQHQVLVPGMDSLAWRRLELEAELRVAWNRASSSCTTSPSWSLPAGR
jgi:hypothetical protein